MEGRKPKAPAKKLKRGKKRKKKGPQSPHGQGQEEDSNETLAISPDRKAPRGLPRGGDGLFDDMLKKSCPYHKGSVYHTLKQCNMLCKYYNRVTCKGEDMKKDAGAKDDGSFPRWRTRSSSLADQRRT